MDARFAGSAPDKGRNEIGYYFYGPDKNRRRSCKAENKIVNMKRSDELSRRLWIVILVICVIEVLFVGTAVVCAVSGQWERAVFWLVAELVLDGQFAGYRCAMQDRIDKCEVEETFADLYEAEDRKTFPERLDELNRKNNKQ